MKIMKKITITQALAELKLLDKKIDKKIRSLKESENWFIDFISGNSQRGKFTGLTIDELKVKATSTKQSITDLIEYRKTLKSKIALSNAKTEVEIDGKKYTIVEAIERKKSLQSEKDFVRILSQQNASVRNQVENENEEAKETIQNLLAAKLGSDSKNQSKKEIDDLIKNLTEMYTAKTLDPLGISSYIEELEDEIESFENNVDVVLSISNAGTFIEIN